MMSKGDNIAVSVVNIVGSGVLGVEIDLEALATDLAEAEYNPDNYHGLYIRFSKDDPLTTIYRSGKYIITGADSVEELYDTRSRVLSLLQEVGVLSKKEDNGFEIQNFVCQGDLGYEVNLNAVAVGLGLERTEYEPEQFPGLVFRPDEYGCVPLIFGSGKVVITGASSVDEAEDAFSSLVKDLDQLGI